MLTQYNVTWRKVINVELRSKVRPQYDRIRVLMRRQYEITIYFLVPYRRSGVRGHSKKVSIR